MTEDEARHWLIERHGEAALHQLGRLVEMVREEGDRQNLIARSTLETIWSRHIVDSAQLVELAPADGRWIDIGTGGGFPGLVVAVLRPGPIVLVEPRRRRAEFLSRAAAALEVEHASVSATGIEAVAVPAQVISARAVASVEKLLHAAAACATLGTRWLLPRGRVTADDVAQLRQRWTGVFHVEQSLTDPASSILVLEQVARR